MENKIEEALKYASASNKLESKSLSTKEQELILKALKNKESNITTRVKKLLNKENEVSNDGKSK